MNENKEIVTEVEETYTNAQSALEILINYLKTPLEKEKSPK